MSSLIVHVPEIEYLPGGLEALPAGLARRLARAQRIESSHEAALAAALGLEILPAPGLLSRLSSGPIAEASRGSHWLRFDVLGMVPDMNSVWIERPMALDFSRSELAPLAAEIEAMLAAEGLDWQPIPGASFGLIELGAAPQAEFIAPEAAIGRRLDEVLPSGPEANRWRRMINESQMVFHALRPLDRPDQRGAALWFWGPGTLLPRPSLELRIADAEADPLMRGLARWLGVDDPQDLGPQQLAGAAPLLLHWSLSGDPQARLDELERHWLAPARGPVDLVGSRGRWRLAPLDRYAFWRRGRPQGFVEVKR